MMIPVGRTRDMVLTRVYVELSRDTVEGRVPAVPLQVTVLKYGTSGDTSKNSNDTRAQIQ